MQSSRVERPEQLTIEVGRWSASVTSVVVTLVFVLVVGMLANSVRANHARAEDWHQRARDAEEIVGGLRLVIADRSRALNQRTRQANELAARLDTTGTALRRSKASVGTLTRRERQLAKANALAAAERQRLQRQQRALVSVASALNACTQGLEAVVTATKNGKAKAVGANASSHLAKCSSARARLAAYLKQAG